MDNFGQNRDVFNSGVNSTPQYRSTSYDYEYEQARREMTEDLTRDVTRKSFIFMFIALMITTFAALTTSPITAVNLVASGGFIGVIIAELAIVFISSYAIKNNNVVLAGVLYTIYAYLTGFTFAIIFIAYDLGSIGYAFGVTAVMFAIMAVFGFVTKVNLTKLGNLCLMGLIGMILATVGNYFIFHSSGFELIECYVVIALFIGITAWDVQKIKVLCSQSTEDRSLSLALMCGFDLYLDFINIFLRVLRIMGRRK